MSKIIVSILTTSVIVISIVYISGNEGRATVDVAKNRLFSSIQTTIGKGDISIQKYQNKIKKVKNNLIKLKINIKVYENKITHKKNSLQKLKDLNSSNEKEKIIEDTIDEMETFLAQMKLTETKLEQGLKKMVNSLDIITMKVSALEAKKEMLETEQSLQEFVNIEDDIGGIDSIITDTINDMQKDIYAIEAEMEIDKMFK